MKNFYQWYRKHITGAIFTGLILGILTGLFLAGRFEIILTTTSVLGSIYMNALNMMIFPMVFCSIVMGITGIGSAKQQERLPVRLCCSFSNNCNCKLCRTGDSEE